MKDTDLQLEHSKTLALARVCGEGRGVLTDEIRKINSTGLLSTLNATSEAFKVFKPRRTNVF